jgi:predicted Zn finger-like uncharacterized protein
MPAVHCPQCQTKFNVAESALGKSARCSKCQHRFVLELPKPAADDGYELAPLDAPMPTSSSVLPSFASAPTEASATSPLGPTRSPVGTLAEPEGKPRRERTSQPPWVLPAAIGAGVVSLLVMAVVGFLVVRSFGGSSGGGGMGNPFAAKPIVGEAQRALPGDYSPVVPAPLSDANAATWKVTPDGSELASGLKTAIPLVNPNVGAVLFAAPPAAKFALLAIDPRESKLEWIQHDLRADEPLARIPLADPEGSAQDSRDTPRRRLAGSLRDARFLAALSPSGSFLALRSLEAARHIDVWSADGKHVAKVETPSEVTWLGIADGDRLLVLAGDRLSGYELPAGKQAFDLATAITGRPQLSPGRKWIAGFTGKSVDIHAAADGSVAGTLPLPPKWFEKAHAGAPPLKGGVVFQPDGKTLVGLFCPSDLYVTQWDTATGKAQDAFRVPYLHSQRYLGTRAIWCGPRQLLLSSLDLLDLDLRTTVVTYGNDPEEARWLGDSPDGRYWRIARDVRSLVDDSAFAVGTDPVTKGSPEFVVQGAVTILAASTVPDAKTAAALSAARKGFVWHPGMDIRVELDPSTPADEREKTLEAISHGLAQQGYAINPKAKFGVRFNARLGNDRVQGKMTKMLGPNYAEYEVVAGVVGTAMMQVVDDQGRPVMGLGGTGAGVSATNESGGAESVWRQIREIVGRTRAPRLFFRDADGKLVPVPTEQAMAIEGIYDPPPEAGKSNSNESNWLQTDRAK